MKNSELGIRNSEKAGRSGLLKGLNPEQLAAVTHGGGPVLVVAGPGTGKTRVLTHRIAHLIEEKLAKPEEILALTFNERAAREMAERVDLLVPYGYIETTISTFHAFGDRVLRDHALELGLSYKSVMTPAEQVIFISDHLFEFELEHYRPLGNPTRHIIELRTLISRAKDEAVSADEYLEYAERAVGAASSEEEKLAAAKQREVARFYATYQELVAREGRIDYGDQVLRTLELFRKHPDVLAGYRKESPWILVDEFQDTNRAQFELIKLLAGPAGNLMVVGDDDQAIYRFRGAALSNVLEFKTSYPKAGQVVLRRNYRSGQAILDPAYRLIQENNPDRLEPRLKISKKLESQVGRVGEVRTESFQTVSEEADAVAERIAGLIEKGVGAPEIAILTRTNRAALPFIQALSHRGIPYQFSGSEGLYEQAEVRLLIDVLRAVADPSDSRAVYNVAVSELYRAPMAETLGLLEVARKRNESLYALIGETETLAGLSKAGEQAYLSLREDVERALERSRGLEVGPVLYQFLRESGFLEALTKAEREAEVHNVARFFDQIRDFQQVSQDRSVVAFIRHLEELIEAGEDPSAAQAELSSDAVVISTVHAAKGLEWRHVFMVQMVQDLFPTRRQSGGIVLPDELCSIPAEREQHLAEERRLCYVAMTRAKESLTLSWAKDLGGRRTRKPSQFLAEALELTFAKEDLKLQPIERIERFAPVPAPTTGVRRIADDEPMVLSRQQIDDYAVCPRRYYYLHVLRLPAEPSHSLVYGRSVHEAIQELYRARLRAEEPTRERMLEVFRASWESEGFLSREHEEARFAKGEELIKKFFKKHRADLAPLFIEQKFAFPVGVDRVTGRWDYAARLSTLPSPRRRGSDPSGAGEEQAPDQVGGDNFIEIVDFKTGQVTEQKEAEKRSRENLQLGIYALAYREVYGQNPDALTLYFVESGLKGTTRRTEAQLDETVELIKKVAAGIRARDFAPSPTHPRDCLCLKLLDTQE